MACDDTYGQAVQILVFVSKIRHTFGMTQGGEHWIDALIKALPRYNSCRIVQIHGSYGKCNILHALIPCYVYGCDTLLQGM